ncbi:MAG: ATP-dependent zinc metalloprotease FtsH, partial [Verrucomicrobiota bacterium]
ESFASQQTFHEAEHHMRSLLDENYEATTKTLSENRAALEAIATALIARETLAGDEVRQLVTEAKAKAA